MIILKKLKPAFKGFWWSTLCCLFCQIILIRGYARAWGIPGVGQLPSVITQEVLVRYRPEATFAGITNTYQQLNLFEITYSPFSGTRRVRIPLNADSSTVASVLNQNPLVAYAEPNYLRAAHLIPNDPLYEYQWHLNSPMMQQTWDLSLGLNVVVAVLDTGIAHRNGDGYARAPDLMDTDIMPGYDFVNDDPYPDDDCRHGTHIAGTIAQSTNNLWGGAGVAPGCTLMPVKVLDADGYGDTADIVDGIYYAVNNGAQIINMSLGGPRNTRGRRRDRSAIEEEAINYAVSQGVTVICSAGNDASDIPNYPAAYEPSISVSACKYDQSFAEAYSNFGPTVDICAPGGDFNEDKNGDGHPDGVYQETHNGTDYMEFDYYFADGTSSAAAFASGVAALILSSAPQTLTPAEVREILQSSAIDLGDPGWDQFYGWGLVNPLAAVQTAIAYSVESRLVQNLRYYAANQYLNSLTNLTLFSLPVNQTSRQASAHFETLNQALNTIYRNAFSTLVTQSYQTQGNYLPEVENKIIDPREYLLLSNPSPFQALFPSDLIFSSSLTPTVSWPSNLFFPLIQPLYLSVPYY